MAASMKILKTKQQMYSHWSLPVFTVAIRSYGDISVNEL